MPPAFGPDTTSARASPDSTTSLGTTSVPLSTSSGWRSRSSVSSSTPLNAGAECASRSAASSRRRLRLVQLRHRGEPLQHPVRLACPSWFDSSWRIRRSSSATTDWAMARSLPMPTIACGLDEERLPRLARVVDDARHLAPVVGHHRHHVPAVAEGVVVLAQLRQEALVVEQLVQLRT